MVLGNFQLQRTTNLENSKAGAYCFAVGADGDYLDSFSLAYHSSFFSLYLCLGATRYRLKYCLLGPVKLIVDLNCPLYLILTLCNKMQF